MSDTNNVPGVSHLLSIANMPSNASTSDKFGESQIEPNGDDPSPTVKFGREPSYQLSRPDEILKGPPPMVCNPFSYTAASSQQAAQPPFPQFAETPLPCSQLLSNQPQYGDTNQKAGSNVVMPYEGENDAADADEESTTDDDNILTVNILLQFQPVSYGMHQISWAALDVALQVIEKRSSHEQAFNSTYGSEISVPSVHTMKDSTEIAVDGAACNVLQKTLEIPMSSTATLCAAEVTFFDVNLIFKETQTLLPDWCITASCYVGLQSARKVLYPIRCSFSRALVDRTGTRPTFYCSFAVKHNLSNYITNQNSTAVARGIHSNLHHQNHDQLSHVFPQIRSVREELADAYSDPASSDSSASKEKTIPDKKTLKSSSSHGMRPIGPAGRLMTTKQRNTFSSIRKRFAKTPARERKHVMTDSDLYPLFTLGRDECAKEMGTCPTWLKVRMRERGIKVWPNRKLIPTTSTLYRLKQHLQEIEDTNAENGKNENRVASQKQIQDEIDALRKVRMGIVRSSCSPDFYAKFSETASPQILDPDWER